MHTLNCISSISCILLSSELDFYFHMLIRAFVNMLISEQFNSRFPTLLPQWVEKCLVVPMFNISLVGVCALGN